MTMYCWECSKRFAWITVGLAPAPLTSLFVEELALDNEEEKFVLASEVLPQAVSALDPH